MSEKKSFSSQSLEGAETLRGREAHDDKDVFGDEEEHDVRKCRLSGTVAQSFSTLIP